MATVFYVTGPLKSGKTTRLAAWCENRKDVAGLLSPVLTGKRWFRNLKNGDLKPMEAENGETQVQQIGKYLFSSETFAWANETLMQATHLPGISYLVIDEIGPLELQGNGLAPALEKILSSFPAQLDLVLVIRETLLEEMLRHFRLHQYPVFPFHFPDQVL